MGKRRENRKIGIFFGSLFVHVAISLILARIMVWGMII